MRTLTLLMCLTVLLTLPAAAQDGYPLPDDLQPITTANARQLEPLAAIGGLLPGDVRWSPDGKLLVIGTSGGVQIYDPAKPEQPLRTIQGIKDYRNFWFMQDGELYADGQRWNVNTGELIDPPPPQPAEPILSPSGKIEVQVRKEGTNIFIDLIKPDKDITSFNTGVHDHFDHIIFSPQEDTAALVMVDSVDGYEFPVVSLWDVNTGKSIVEKLPTYQFFSTLTFHGNGELFITASSTDEGYGYGEERSIWDVDTGKRIGPSSYCCLPINFSSDGRLMAMFSSEGIEVWSDHQLGWLEYWRANEQSPLLFSPDSKTLITTSDKEIALWDVSQESISDVPRQILQTVNEVYQLIYSPDGSLLVSTERNNFIEVWDALTGMRVWKFSTKSTLYKATFIHDGRLLHASGSDFVLVWDITIGQQIASLPFDAEFNPSGTQAAFWDGGSVNIIDILTNQQRETMLIQKLLGEVKAFEPVTGLAIFAYDDLHGYDMVSKEQVFLESGDKNRTQVEFDTSGHYMMTTEFPIGLGSNIPVYMTIRRTDNLEKAISQIEFPDRGRDILLSSDGRFLSQLEGVCGDGGGGGHDLRNTEMGEVLFSDGGDNCGPYAHAFSLDTKWLLIGWDGGRVDLISLTAAIQEAASDKNHWAFKSTKQLYFRPYGAIVEQINISPDGAIVAIQNQHSNYGSGNSYDVNLISLSDLVAQDHRGELNDISTTIPDAQFAIFSPDSRWLLTNNGFWDVATGDKLASVGSSVAAFTSDSTVLATYDHVSNSVALWDVAALSSGNEMPLTTFELDGEEAISFQLQLAFSPDDKHLYVRSDGNVRVWGVPPVQSAP